jgi:leucyl-tRNA synthetase
LQSASSYADHPWPSYDEALCKDEVIEVPVQVNGKVRGRVTVAADAGESDVRAAAEREPNVAQHLAGRAVKKFVYVPGRIVNFIV